MARPIRVLIADSQAIDRRGLALLIAAEPGLVVVGEAATSAEAIQACGCLQPDVLLLDTKMSGLDGVTAIPAVRAASPGTRVIAIAERSESRCLVLDGMGVGESCSRATDCLTLGIAHGAHGALRRSADPADLVRAVRAVAAGHAWYEAGVAARLLANEPGERAAVLTPRERQVAEMIASGRSNKEIAVVLGVGEATVKKHVGGLLAKLGLQDRLQIGLHVVRNPMLVRRRAS